MAFDTKPAAFYADFKSLAALKKNAVDQDPKALREAARQFESLFTQMMLKSARQASLGKGLFESDQTDFYREMFDNQMATQMSKGKGIGLADMLVKQLQGIETRDAGHEKSRGIETRDARRETSTIIETRDTGHGTRPKVSTLSLPLEKADSSPLKFAPPSNAPLSFKTNNVGKDSAEPTLRHAPPTNAPITANAALESIIARANATVAEDGEVRVWCGNMDDAIEPATNESESSLLTRPASRVSRLDSVLTNPESRIPSLESDSSDPARPASRVSRPDSHVPVATSPADFVTQLWPHAKAAAEELGVDPRMLIAHAALETGWGKSIPCNPDGTCSFNLFGIKTGSRWQGPAVGVNTVEFEDGVAVRRRASFRAYDSPADSFRDYATLIKSSPRYAAALGAGNDAAAFANALQQGGYATDPNYANKLTAVAERLSATLKIEPPRPLAFGRSVSIAGANAGGET